MKFVIIESPYSGDIDSNVEYAKDCMMDSITRMEVPFASHLLYTQVLDDKIQDERYAGMTLGYEVMKRADLVAVYTDKGISEGMESGIKLAKKHNKEIEYRSI